MSNVPHVLKGTAPLSESDDNTEYNEATLQNTQKKKSTLILSKILLSKISLLKKKLKTNITKSNKTSFPKDESNFLLSHEEANFS